ncbi:unnamed protein product [Fusarium graminearum]|nr:unnamed protein product [Fusarium graminearum]
MSTLSSRPGDPRALHSGQNNGAPETLTNSKSNATLSGNRTTAPASASSFAPQVRTLGEGIPGFRTSFNVAGKGGGAFRSISEDFEVSPANGTMSLAIPVRTSPTRGGYGPDLKLSYDSGSGNGPFGFGWSMSMPSIHRKTTHAIPRYVDDEDDFLMSGGDIIKRLNSEGIQETRNESGICGKFLVTTYRPRVDSGNIRIERWVRREDLEDVHWRTISSSNETQIYGDSDSSRIFDASGPSKRIFSWLLSRSYDASGNAIEYVYKEEDSLGIFDATGAMPVWEKNREQDARYRERYIKRVKYGNRKPNRDLTTWEVSDWPEEWMFEVVFDYGEHDKGSPSTEESHSWPVRQDMFSQSRPGFEIRTYRLCRRILMFHHFPEHTQESETFVFSTDLQYNESRQRTVLASLVATGYSSYKDNNDGKQRYRSESLPPWSFEYTSSPEASEIELMEAKTFNLLELPTSDARVSEWLDLDGDGMPGLLTRSVDGALYYQRNLGSISGDDDPQFCGPVLLAQQPSMTGGTFQDLDRNGNLNYVLRNEHGHLEGYYERGNSDTWKNYIDFPETSNGDIWQSTIDIDLTGDGHPDLICAADDSQVLIWQQNLGKKGLSSYQRVICGHDWESCPRLIKNQDVQTYVGDMTGSGMSDLVEISVSSVRYWPNLGYGTFGAAVDMGNPPAFAAKDYFDHSRVRLMDTDGSGTMDLLYALPTGGAALYYNLAGNSWSNMVFLPHLPAIIKPMSIFSLDLIGKGADCLCWADTSTDGNRIMYLDITGETKPHLLKSYSNGRGATTSVDYAPSTKFFAEDTRTGHPWSSKLPFPVQCVSKVQVEDTITGNRQSTKYIYHNGCYNPTEKQFSGFEMVEQFQSERVIVGEDETYEPPVTHTKSWFNVGLSLVVDESRFLTKPAILSSLQDYHTDPAELVNALKGLNVRSEIYSQDGSPKSHLPYVIKEVSYHVKISQARDTNKYSAVQVLPRETFSRVYERDMSDPRVTHDMVIKTNDFGDVEESLSIVYPRAGKTTFEDVNKNQKAGNMSYTHNWYTKMVSEPEQQHFRKPAAYRQQEHEILSFPFNGTLKFDDALAFNFNGLPTTKCSTTWKALRSENKAFYKDSLLQRRLDEGELQTFSLLDQTYALAFTPDILAKVEIGLRNCNVPGSVEELLTKGSYVKLKDSDGWWAPSSQSFFCSSKTVSAAEELKEARKSFYTPSRFVDLFGNSSRLNMDKDFLLATEVEDAIGTVTSFKNSYEHLQPVEIIDANSNSVQVVLDPLGDSIAVAASTRRDGVIEEIDNLVNMVLDVSPEDVDDILRDPTGEVSTRLLGNAASRTIHYRDRYAQWKSRQNETSTSVDPEPALSLVLSRDLSFKESSSPEIRVVVSYMNGLGSQYQEQHLSDPTTLEKRWLVPGLAIPDTQGQVVCTYEPRFATLAAPIPSSLMKTNSAFTFYDAMGRNVASLAADCTWSKTVYTPWTTVEHGAGSMVLQSNARDDPDVGHFFSRIASSRYSQSWYDKRKLGTAQEKRAAEKSAIYSDTPLTTHLGSCGLPVRTIQQAGGKTYTRSSMYDVSGNRIRDVDSYERTVEKMLYDKLGRQLQTTGMDCGESWLLLDAQGGEILSWNCRGYSFITRYDPLRRETERLVAKAAEMPKLISRITYGETCGDAINLNLNGQVWKVEDQAGVHINTHYNIRGHCLGKTLQFTKEYKQLVDWKLDQTLETEVYPHTYFYDNYGQVLQEEDEQGNRTRRNYSRQGHVVSVDFSSIKGRDWKSYLSGATFSADGLPITIKYGNGVVSDFFYDDESRNLISQRTTRPCRGRRELLQDMTHIYDYVGRRIFTSDGSEQVKYFGESRVKPEWDYTYNATGALVIATGRAQLSGKIGNGNQLTPHNAMNGLNPSRGGGDGNLLYQYRETYDYDREGNILMMKHEAPDIKGVTSWTRNYHYDEKSLLSDDPRVKCNRLSRTSIGDTNEGKYMYEGSAGLSGCITTLPKFSELDWNMNNMLSFSSTQYVNAGTPERTYYVYDHAGNRVRKVTETAAKSGEEPRKQRDTLFFGGVELQTKSNGSLLWTTRVKGDGIVAVVEVNRNQETPLVRFQAGRDMEFDDQAQLISYEEYSPFGAVVYAAMYGNIEAPRAYRFARYEHDSETGLYHCGQRYYCPWLGRWTSPDPLGDVDGPNLFVYVNNDPVNSHDPSGTSGKKTKEGTREMYAAPDDQGKRRLVDENKAVADRIAKYERKLQRQERKQQRAIARMSGTDPILGSRARYAVGIAAMGNALGRISGSTELHHTYPQEYREEFSDIDINVDRTSVSISKEAHYICTYGSVLDNLVATNKRWKSEYFDTPDTGYYEQMEQHEWYDDDPGMQYAIRLHLAYEARTLNGKIMADFGINPKGEDGRSMFVNYDAVTKMRTAGQRRGVRNDNLIHHETWPGRPFNTGNSDTDNAGGPVHFQVAEQQYNGLDADAQAKFDDLRNQMEALLGKR